jgi:hypothetical protein
MLTRGGWGAVALGVTCLVVGRTFGIVELYVLGAGVIGAAIVALVVVNAAPPQYAVRRRIEPSTVQAGDPARVDLQVANTARRRTPTVQLWEPVGGGGGATMHLGPLRAGERTLAAYRLPSARRGVIRVGPMKVRRRDVLGLASRTAVLPGQAELLVLPRHIPLRFALGTSSGRLGDHLRLRAHGQSGSEFHSLRQYVPGDDLRRISWKASARSTELVVKETALEGVRRCTVVLDLHAEPEPFEMAVTATASAVTGAVVAGLNTRLVAPDTDLRGSDVGPVALRWLAAATPRTDAVAGAIAALPSLKAGEGIGIVALVTAQPAGAFAGAVRAALGPDDTLVVIDVSGAGANDAGPANATGPARPRGRGDRFTIVAPDLDALLAGWIQLTGAAAVALPSAYHTGRAQEAAVAGQGAR